VFENQDRAGYMTNIKTTNAAKCGLCKA